MPGHSKKCRIYISTLVFQAMSKQSISLLCLFYYWSKKTPGQQSKITIAPMCETASSSPKTTILRSFCAAKLQRALTNWREDENNKIDLTEQIVCIVLYPLLLWSIRVSLKSMSGTFSTTTILLNRDATCKRQISICLRFSQKAN
jgi:hypothetical protein